jgi:hypothetical protein
VVTALPVFAGRCELVWAPATERPSPVRTINVNRTIGSRVEEPLPVSFHHRIMPPRNPQATITVTDLQIPILSRRLGDLIRI